MKRLDILRIVIGFIFMFNTITVALAKDYRVVEIDSMEYYSAKCGFENECLTLARSIDYVSGMKNFLYTIVKSDQEARDIYLDEIISNGESRHVFCGTYFGCSMIEFLQFRTPFVNFMYVALIQSINEFSISDIKINSAPIVISKDGYIAGFRETAGKYFADFKIYKMALDKRGDLDITEEFSYLSQNGDPWHVSSKPFPVFWKKDVLYIEGVRLRQSNENKYFDEPCYFKAERE